MRHGGDSLLREVAFAYVQARRRFEQFQSRGDVDKADEAFTQLQTIEQSIQVTELNSAWRHAAA